MTQTTLNAFVIAFLATASAASANNLEYMIHPTPEDHKIPTHVTEVKNLSETNEDQKTFAVKYETPSSQFNELSPATGENNIAPEYDHFLGH